jgi:hypothetical protein
MNINNALSEMGAYYRNLTWSVIQFTTNCNACGSNTPFKRLSYEEIDTKRRELGNYADLDVRVVDRTTSAWPM